jgi:hypothetical protein
MLDITAPSDLSEYPSSFRSPEGGTGNPSDKDLQRAHTSGRIVVSGSEKGTASLRSFNNLPFASCSHGPSVVRYISKRRHSHKGNGNSAAVLR